MPGPSGDLIQYSATDMRQLLYATQGVIDAGSWLVTQRAEGANLSVDVSAGRGVIAGTDLTNQGNYLPSTTGVVNVATPLPVPTSGNSRIDSIIAQVLDADQNGGGSNLFQITVVKGTAAATGSQVAPTLPATCMLLANVLVGPSAATISSGNITDQRVLSGRGLPSGRVTGAGSIPSGTPTLITSPSTDFVSGGMTAGSNGLIVPIGGIYEIKTMAFALMPLTGALTISAAPKVNGAGSLFPPSAIYDAGTGVVSISNSEPVKLNAGDVITIIMSCTATASVNVETMLAVKAS